MNIILNQKENHLKRKLENQHPTSEAIVLEHVHVSYRIPNERIHTFKEYAIRWVQGRVQHRQVLALRDVNLDIHHGETFGVIGNNGAGKSTLLKLVARVLRPTKGRVIVRGTIAPLLQYGAGFHPDDQS